MLGQFSHGRFLRKQGAVLCLVELQQAQLPFSGESVALVQEGIHLIREAVSLMVSAVRNRTDVEIMDSD